MTSLRTRLSLALRVLALAVFANHFLQTALYVMPNNVLKDGTLLGRVNAAYMLPYFDQVWTLFAPNPVSTDTLLLVQCLAPGQKPRAHAWVDILTPVWAANQRNRLSAYDRFSRTIENPLRDIVQLPIHLVEAAKKCEGGDAASCDAVKKGRRASRDRALGQVRDAASVYCLNLRRETRLPFERVSRIALRIRVVTPPTWRDRHTARSRTQDYDLGVHATRVVAAPPVYRSSR
ncbi:DUF5819 family protein [Deinococcus pimensis]|uniref:DUF5819 family protein n=1 Tax=Deinococcus pimensis TaxID=309888 RepID=UPI000483E177|nr:DUF5819 family protein [Deinococcus pimensis]